MKTIEINNQWNPPQHLEPGHNIRILHIGRPFTILLKDFNTHRQNEIEITEDSDNPFIILLLDDSNELDGMPSPSMLFKTKGTDVFSISFENWLPG